MLTLVLKYIINKLKVIDNRAQLYSRKLLHLFQIMKNYICLIPVLYYAFI